MNNTFFYKWILLIVFMVSYSSHAAAQSINLPSTIEKASNYLQSNGVNDDWAIVSLLRAGKPIPSTYFKLKEEELIAVKGEFRRVTAIEKSILGIVATGGDPRSVAGYDLISKVLNSELTAQGLNGVIYALISLDSKGYSVPKGSRYTREVLIQELLSQQNEDGGWPLFQGGKSDIDTTAMTLTALAPYINKGNVKRVGQKAITWLSSRQEKTGGYLVWGSEASESVSQVILALCSWGIDPTSMMFTKEGGNALTNLISFRKTKGSFSHTVQGEENAMSTTQALQALVAYDYFLKGKGRFYHFGTVEQELKPTKPIEKIVIKSTEQKEIQEKKAARTSWTEKVKMSTSFRPIEVRGETPVLSSSEKQEDTLEEPIQDLNISRSSNSSVSTQTDQRNQSTHYLQAWLPIGIGCAFVIWGLALKWYRRREL